MSQLREYYYLTKPGIIRGNLLTAIAGYLFAAKGDIEVATLIGLVAGVVCVIAAGCVFNNIVDAEIDSHMLRTKKRALVTGSISSRRARLFGVILAILGFGVLLIVTNWITTIIGLVALFLYVVVYGHAKRTSVHGTFIGAFPGAAAILAGFTAATGELETAGLLIALSMIFWQMPHFYAIAIFRLQEYKAANLPVLPAIKGLAVTRIQILVYIVLFGLSTTLLTATGYASVWFAVVMGLASLYWLYIAIFGYSVRTSSRWARKVFGVSLIVLLAFSVMLSIDNLMP